MRDAARESAHRLQALTMPQLLLQFFAPDLRNFLLLDFRLQAMVDPHQFAAHAFEVRGQFMQLADAGGDLQGLRIVAGGDGAGDVLQSVDRARQTVAQHDGNEHRHAEIARQHHHHSVQGEIDSFPRRLLVETEPQFGAPARVHDRQHHEKDIVAVLREAQIRAARRLDAGRSQLAEHASSIVDQFRVASVAVDDGQIEQVFGSGCGIQGHTQFKFIGEHPRKGARMLDEQVLVALADHITQSVVQRGQENEVQRNHARGDIIGERCSQSCHNTRSILMRLSR